MYAYKYFPTASVIIKFTFDNYTESQFDYGMLNILIMHGSVL